MNGQEERLEFFKKFQAKRAIELLGFAALIKTHGFGRLGAADHGKLSRECDSLGISDSERVNHYAELLWYFEARYPGHLSQNSPVEFCEFIDAILQGGNE